MAGGVCVALGRGCVCVEVGAWRRARDVGENAWIGRGAGTGANARGGGRGRVERDGARRTVAGGGAVRRAAGRGAGH